MSADPSSRVLARTIAKNLKQCDPAALEVTAARLRRAAHSQAPDVSHRLRECEKFVHGIEIHLRAIVELIEARARGALPGTEKARFAQTVARHRAEFAACCDRELDVEPTPSAEDSTAAAAAAAFRTRRETVDRLFERLAGLFAW